MVIFAIAVSVIIALGMLVLYASLSYAEVKGYERGLDEAEQIVRETREKYGERNMERCRWF